MMGLSRKYGTIINKNVDFLKIRFNKIFLALVMILIFGWTTNGQHISPCIGRRDGTYLHPKKCDWFVKCAGGVSYEQPCSSGLHFSEKTNTCDYPMEAACPYVDSHSNSELFWKKMTLGLWGFNNAPSDHLKIKAKKEEIINKNIQFNLQTEATAKEVDNNKLTNDFKTISKEPSSFWNKPPDYGISYKETQEPITHKVIYGEQTLNDKSSSVPENYEERNFDNKDDLEKINHLVKVKQEDFSNDKVIKSYDKEVTFNKMDTTPFQEIHEVNAGTHKYVYTEPVTQSMKPSSYIGVNLLKPSGFRSTGPGGVEPLNDEGETSPDTITTAYDQVYDDHSLKSYNVKKIKKDKHLEKKESKGDNETKKNNPVSNFTNNYNKNTKKLDDFMGPHLEENIHANIHNQDSWKKWFSAFLPKEEDIGRSYQQELLGKIFPRQEIVQGKLKLEEHTKEPIVVSTDRSHGQQGVSHGLPKESHDHGNDYAPLELDGHSWQSITPAHHNKHNFHHGNQRIPHHYKEDHLREHRGDNSYKPRRNRPLQNPARKERYGKHSSMSPTYPGYDRFTDSTGLTGYDTKKDPFGYAETIYGMTSQLGNHDNRNLRHFQENYDGYKENQNNHGYKSHDHHVASPSDGYHDSHQGQGHHHGDEGYHDNNAYPSVFTEDRSGHEHDFKNPPSDIGGYSRMAHEADSSFYGQDDMQSAPKRAMSNAKYMVRQRLKSEDYYSHKMQGVVDSGPFRYVSAFLNAKPYAKQIGRAGMQMVEVLKIVKNKYKLDGPGMKRLIHHMPEGDMFLKPLPEPGHPDIHMPVPPDVDYCPYPSRYVCDPKYPYRSMDGSCNNLDHPLIGRSMVPHRRLLYQNYEDGIESARVSVRRGVPLPGPRLVSLHMFPDVDRPSQLHTLLLMIWGQFIDHDLTRTAITEMQKEDGGIFETEEVKCGFDGCTTNEPGLESCWPIPIPEDDPDFRYNRCLKFVRSQEVPPLDCKLGPREQLNQVTTWLDGSQIYGSTKEESDGLRDYSDPRRGRMAITPHPHGSRWKPLLPQDDMVDICRDTNATVKCFKAGDERVNEQSGLTAMHTVWMRQHNRIEDELHQLNPHWDGERLFQETRKIIGSQIQHIVFNEHLPLLLGPAIMKQYGLNLMDDGFYHHYDATVDGRIANEFSTAAFRFGHTLIQDRFRRSDANYNSDDTLMLSTAFRRPGHIYDTARGGVDGLVRGLCDFPAQTYDHFFTKQITRSLFTETPPNGPGMDLMSLNLQRARDHGLQGYNAYRELCGLGRAHDFSDLSRDISDPLTIDILRRVYKHVDDIDLFVGGVSEASVKGGVVGPTFACILANQFRTVRKGDRFWYENDHEGGFTREQIFELRKTRLAQILCINGDDVSRIQPWVLLKPFRDVYPDLNMNGYDSARTGMPFNDFASLHEQNFNARTSCRSLPKPDLKAWKHGPYVP